MVQTEEQTYTYSKEPAVSWKKHNGIDYLSVNFSGLDGLEIMNTITSMKKTMEERPDGSIRYYLNVKDADLGFNMNMTLRKISARLQPKIKRSAFYGVNGYLIPFFKVYKSFTKSKAVLFESEEEALNYICSD